MIVYTIMVTGRHHTNHIDIDSCKCRTNTQSVVVAVVTTISTSTITQSACLARPCIVVTVGSIRAAAIAIMLTVVFAELSH